MQGIEDRRVRRTRRNLVEALVGLIIERGYARITVQDILDRADVGRSTFYAHFRDKEALLHSCFDDLREELIDDLDRLTPDAEPPDSRNPSIVVFAHAYQHRRVYRALCGRRGGDVVHAHLHALIAGAVAAHVAPHLAAKGSPIPVQAVAEFYTSALLGMLTWWVRQGFPHGPDHIARMYGSMANPGIRALLASADSRT